METVITEIDRISVHMNNNNNEDDTRSDEPWNDKNEGLLKNRLDDIRRTAKLHENSGYYFGFKHKLIGIPALIIPVVMSPASALFRDSYAMSYIGPCMFLLSGILSSLNTFYNPSIRSGQHFQFNARYSDLITEIETELGKTRRFRTQSDVFMMKVQMTMENLGGSAPCIPKNIQI